MTRKRVSPSPPASPPRWDPSPHLSEDYYYDEAFADRVVNWFPSYIRHTVGPLAGKPFVLSPWQEFDIIRPLFGIKRKDDNTRRYRTVWLEIPKKNGKTTLIAAVNLLATVGLGESGAQVYCLACDRKQARICFDEAVRMVRASEEVDGAFEIYRDQLMVPAVTTKDGRFFAESIFRPLSSEVASNDGYNASAVTIDEVHRQPNWELYRVMQYSTSAREQPFFFMATTAGLWDTESLYYSLHERAMKIRSGEIVNPSWLVCWYGADPEDDWKEEATWKKANPELGAAKSIKAMREDFAVALADANEQNNFKRLHLNIITNSVDSWLNMEDWNACDLGVEDASLLGRECWAGVDLSSNYDMTSLCLCFPLEDGSYVLRSWFWLPADNIQRLQDESGAPYDVWARDGWLSLTEGNIIDHRSIEQVLVDCMEKYQLKEVAFDPYNARQFAVQAMERGVDMVEFRQTVTEFNEPMKTFHKCVTGRTIDHGGNPILTWHASNVVAKRNVNGDIRPDKSSRNNKIDGIVAAIMAMGRATVREQEEAPKDYSRGFVWV